MVYKNATQDSMEFVIQINENGVMMDVKQIVLHEKARDLFKFQHVWYLMILNMNRSSQILIDKNFQCFLLENVKISRAHFYKIISSMLESKLLKKEDKRGWYKLLTIKRVKRQVWNKKIYMR